MGVRREGVRGVAWNSRVVRRIPCMYVDACTYLRRGEECCVVCSVWRHTWWIGYTVY